MPRPSDHRLEVGTRASAAAASAAAGIPVAQGLTTFRRLMTGFDDVPNDLAGTASHVRGFDSFHIVTAVSLGSAAGTRNPLPAARGQSRAFGIAACMKDPQLFTLRPC